MVGDDEFSGTGGIQAEASSTQAPHLLNALSLSVSTGTSVYCRTSRTWHLDAGLDTWMQKIKYVL